MTDRLSQVLEGDLFGGIVRVTVASLQCTDTVIINVQ
jgi:hypothetical protein